MVLNEQELKAFLEYKSSKMKSVSELESGRLGDLKHSRDTVFKYALPASIIDGAAGSLATLLTKDIMILLPVALFVIVIYLLASNLDHRKTRERLDIITLTEGTLDEIRTQEIELLKEAKK